MSTNAASLIAGIPYENRTLYHQIRFGVGDPAALIVLPPKDGAPGRRQLLIRDIEMARAKQYARADAVNCPADFTPAGGLSGDRETATAQATAEFLRRNGVKAVTVDRTLPYYFTHELLKAGLELRYDPELGVRERRMKDEQEIRLLQQAQRDTEGFMRRACEMIANATPDKNGVLHHDGAPLTSERMFEWIDIECLKAGYDNPQRPIVACGKHGGDCHHRGAGPLYTGQPIIVDIFPRNKNTLYWGDCTRTVVHGEIPPMIARMHAAVVAAKAAAMKAIRTGVTGHAVNEETLRVLREHGFDYGFPPADAPADFVSIPHGTGHGVGLDVHEPPLLAPNGPELLEGDCVTVEPGLYGPGVGGVRVEDLVIVTKTGAMNLSSLPEGLTWR
jgi:Xaa-Pro aminopeptidase